MFWIREKHLAIAGILQMMPNEYTTRQANNPIQIPQCVEICCTDWELNPATQPVGLSPAIK
jgi:hypothetical protein